MSVRSRKLHENSQPMLPHMAKIGASMNFFLRMLRMYSA